MAVKEKKPKKGPYIFPDYQKIHRLPLEKDEKIGVLGDTHLCSKFEALQQLQEYYDILEEAGVKKTFHSGDLTDGYLVYMGQLEDIKVWGANAQKEYTIENYPKRKNIKTYVITGNHDDNTLRKGGVNIVKDICRERTDLKYLGIAYSRVLFNNAVKMDVAHDTGRRAYALCFDDKTEILTEDGFKFFWELTDEKVATLNPDTHFLEFQKPTKIHCFEYDGELIHIKSRSVDLLVTPNHELFVRRYPHKINRKEKLKMPQKSHRRLNLNWEKRTAEYIRNNFGRQKFQLKKTCFWNGENREIFIFPFSGKMVKIEPLLKFLGWYVSEGCISSGKQISIFQNEDRVENREEIIQSIKDIGFNPKVQKKRPRDIRIYSTKLAKWLEEECGNGSYNKKIPKWIKQLWPSLINIFLESLFKGDGWKNKQGKWCGYKSVSSKLRNDVVECLLKIGSCGTTWKDTVSILTKQTLPTINKKPKKIHYTGYVYDVTVPNHIILVRRNGKVVWSGNSYPLQKRQRDTPPKYRPHISVVGHRHILFYAYYNDEHMFETGCFEHSSPYLRGRGVQSAIGAWILEMQLKRGAIKKIKPELITFP